ncbi:MAG: bifunctional hexulose-6-phosphate synthase/ribonuclease regulator [Desulfobacterales bacterium C00003060]|nr:MAG: bifunctional hexulose-6-phosphate synthase/ribonuclease regulator [Desulfobacterales bacterium S3730MH5]OEU77913.1 MAG: bifunctional hexulose-6-phosphate synthase/ribonuclease regulator [Desulfobacterales bacterium C00003060]OEU84608.1 MAG: bifunctional hexulose-6-phosphate synthase/ribonuclease regulator [Desulfobacterales bacterium S5133MH4]
MKPVLQLALDYVDLKRAVKCAKAGVAGGVDWLEVGTPLIKSEGIQAVRELRGLFPHMTIIADMKIMDAGRIEVETAAKAGANLIDVLGAASDATIRECILAGKNYGARIVVDLIAVKDPVHRAKQIEDLGADYIAVHCSIDEQMEGKDPFDTLRRLAEAVSLPLGVAGGVNSETASRALEAGASIVIVGGAITKAVDPSEAAKNIKKAMDERISVSTSLFKRGSEAEVRSVLEQVSTANLSDALHRGGVLQGIRPLFQGIRMAGRAVTVRTYPGDWAKPVEAIDIAEKGDVIVVDAGGVGPAIWGELATHSARQRGVAGIVIDGAIRDTYDIARMKFPAFTRLIMPNAGEPKGFGEIGVPVTVGNRRVESGDWILGDDDGIVVLPKSMATEYANRSMDVLERENRIREEIKDGSTLSKVTELLRWEKK